MRTCLAVGGSASSIGASSNAAANLVFNGGDLQYTGAQTSTDRLFTIGSNGGAIDASGSGPLTFSNTGAAVTTGSYGDLILTGSNTGLNVLTPSFSGTVGIVKNGPGTWVLASTAANNNYNGGTAINQGILQVSAASNLGTGNISFNGGTLQFAAAFDPSTLGIGFNSGGGTIDTQSYTITLANAIGFYGNGSLTKVGAGALILGGANTFSGGVNVNQGTLANGNLMAATRRPAPAP